MKVAILGRFQPLHNGHVNFINNYLKDKLTIGLCASNIQNSINPFSAEDRVKMIHSVYYNIPIIQIPDFNILEEGKDGKMWRDFICVVFDGYDKIISGNPWVTSLLKDYFKVEAPKVSLDISGTLVRNMIASEGTWWDLVPEEVSRYIKIKGLDDTLRLEYGNDLLTVG